LQVEIARLKAEVAALDSGRKRPRHSNAP